MTEEEIKNEFEIRYKQIKVDTKDEEARLLRIAKLVDYFKSEFDITNKSILQVISDE